MSRDLDELVDTKTAGQIVGLHPVTLALMRCRGRGPAYRRLPDTDRIVYRVGDLLNYADAGLVVPRSAPKTKPGNSASPPRVRTTPARVAEGRGHAA